MFKFSKKTSLGIKAVVSLAFVFWLVYKVEWHDVLEHVRHVQVRYLVLYAAFVLLGMAVSAKKWQIIARFKGFQRPLFGCFRAYLTGTFINNFLPGFIGGDMFRAYWLGKQREGYTLAVSTVVFDRLSGLFAAAMLAIGFSLTRYDAMVQSSIWTFLVVVLMALLAVTVFWGMVWRNLGDIAVVQGIVRFLPVKLQTFLGEVRHYFRAEILLPTMALSLIFNIAGVGIANLILFRAFGQNIPVTDFFAVIFIVNIVASIPVSINNIGIKEWAYFTFFPLVFVSPEVAITVAITGRFVQMLISFFALPDFLRRKHIGAESS